MLEPGGQLLAQHEGFDWQVGQQTTTTQLEAVAEWMATAVVAAVHDDPLPADVQALFLTAPLAPPKQFDGVVFSGGVGEYVYGKEPQSFGDLGLPLGEALRARVERGAFPWPVLPANECIRATVMGASQYSVQVSGNTIHALDPEHLLPQRNLQVLRPVVDLTGAITPAAVAAAVRDHFTSFDLTEGDSNVALVFAWQGDGSFQRLNAFAEGLLQALPLTLASGRPLVLVFDQDIAGTVGALLREDQGVTNDVLAIDGVVLRDFDFIDIGRILEPSGTVPVTIKSLVFHM